MANADGSDIVLIDETQGDIQNLQWSPDGTKIAYRWLRSGDYTDTPIIVINADPPRLRGTTPLFVRRSQGPRDEGQVAGAY